MLLIRFISTFEDELYKKGFFFGRGNVVDLLQDRIKVTKVSSKVLSCLRGERGENALDVIFLCHTEPR